MNESIKLFFLGYMSGLFTALICAGGCYLYGRRVRKSSADTGEIRGIEQQQSDACGKLTENERTAAELIQKAKDILNNGKYTNNN